jgi:hypothetical protein
MAAGIGRPAAMLVGSVDLTGRTRFFKFPEHTAFRITVRTEVHRRPPFHRRSRAIIRTPFEPSGPGKFSMSKPKITLETLYDILQDHTRRFDEHDRKFDEQDKRFAAADSLQRTMASRLVSIENTLIEHSAILRPLQDRVASLHSLVEGLAGGVDRLDQEYVMITAALRRLEKRFAQQRLERPLKNCCRSGDGCRFNAASSRRHALSEFFKPVLHDVDLEARGYAIRPV